MNAQKKPEVETKTEFTYAILQETNDEECESWYVFIRYQGNEEALNHLNKQLNQVRWRLEDGLSTFDLELDYLVCERTAKEMTKVDLNHYSFHRKFDGKLQKVDLGFRDTDSNRKKMKKACEVLGYGDIEKYIDGEDIDPEDLNQDDNESESDESDDEESGDESESDDNDKDEKTPPRPAKKQGNVPKVVKPKIEIPRFAKAKAKRRN